MQETIPDTKLCDHCKHAYLAHHVSDEGCDIEGCECAGFQQEEPEE